MFVIETPNKHFNGQREGLIFNKGRAETEDRKLAEKLCSAPWNYRCDQLNPNHRPEEPLEPVEVEIQVERKKPSKKRI